MSDWLPWWSYWVPVGIVGFCALLYHYQHKLIYFPDVPLGYRRHMLSPTDFGLPAPLDVMLPMRDGVKIHLWFFTHPDASARNTIIFLHGNAGNMSFRLENFRALFHTCKANVLAVEYRGFGLSEGTPGEKDFRSDVVEVLHWLRDGKQTDPERGTVAHARDDVSGGVRVAAPLIDTERIFVLGRSIGGAVALHLAELHEKLIAGLIVENTFTSTSEVAQHVLPKLSYFTWLSRNVWANIDVVPKLSLPCLFIHSGRDEIIPRPMMHKLRDSYGGKLKHYMYFDDAQHMNAHTQPGYYEGINEFMAKVLAMKRAQK